MGQSFGKVVAIGKEGVTVRETIRDINGVWVEQEKTLSVPREGGS
jgi:Tfp pilus assembly protein PilP